MTCVTTSTARTAADVCTVLKPESITSGACSLSGLSGSTLSRSASVASREGWFMRVCTIRLRCHVVENARAA